jgi:agmatinase
MPNGTPAARVTLLGVPYDAASSFLRGAAAAPARIREALASPASNVWAEDGTDLGAPGALGDAGDVALDGAEAGDGTRDAITGALRALLATGTRPLVLGGDHSISHPVLRAVRERHPALTVLHVDAHPDLYDAFDGDRHSHACPFARVMEERLADRLVQAGVRTMNGHQRAQAERFGVEVIDMRAWAAGRRPSLDGDVYLSLDLDALDPAFAPGVSHREPGGLTTREVLALVQGVGGRLVGADLVELNPARDVAELAATACAKLVKEIAARLLRDAG